MSATAAAIRDIYAQLRAPEWAAANLDALTDVLRDLSWLPEGPVTVAVPQLGTLTDGERGELLTVLWRAEDESAGSRRPLRLRQ
jgi:RNAse (barnase) inhibitor barstar